MVSLQLSHGGLNNWLVGDSRPHYKWIIIVSFLWFLIVMNSDGNLPCLSLIGSLVLE